jgi:hypothetical protein
MHRTGVIELRQRLAEGAFQNNTSRQHQQFPVGAPAHRDPGSRLLLAESDADAGVPYLDPPEPASAMTVLSCVRAAMPDGQPA